MKDNSAQRRVAIIIAVILGILIAVYLGGLLGQMNTGYQNWLANDGISGGVSMDPLNFDPLFCMSNAFTKDGLMGTLIVVVVAAVIIAYIKLNNRFSSNDLDDRNFARSKKGTYGTAGWMTKKEMKSVLEIASPDSAKGIILGKKDGSVICLPADTLLNKHLCVFGASGTMKSRAIVRPYLFQSIKRGESVVVTDVKGEMYSDTAELFRRNGYTVRVFNLVNPEHSDSWNCMSDLEGDTMMAQILTNITISNTAKGKTDHFWDNGEGNLLKSLILYIDQDATRSPDTKHLPAVYQMLTQNTEKSLSAIFDKLPISHPAKAPYNLFAQSSDTVRAGIVLGLGTRLQVLQNEAIRNITSKSELDLSEPGKTKCAYFVILSDQESSTEFISSLFFSLLFIKLTRYADSRPGQRCKIPVNIVFDEFSNIGQLDTYPRRLSVVRSRGIQVCHVVQSLAQFMNRYPDEQWAEIVGNCDTQIMLGCTEEQTANYWSLRSGEMSVEVNSTMTVRQSIAIAQMIPQYRQTEGLGKRRLLTPDEVFRLPNNEMLIILRGEKMLRANKFDYTGHPFAKRIIQTSVFDYYPQDKQRPLQTENESTQSFDESPVPDTNREKPRERDKQARCQTEIKTRRKRPLKGRQHLDTPGYTQSCQTETKNHLARGARRPGLFSLIDLFKPSAPKSPQRRSKPPHAAGDRSITDPQVMTPDELALVQREISHINQGEPEVAAGSAVQVTGNPPLSQTGMEIMNSDVAGPQLSTTLHAREKNTALCQTETGTRPDEKSLSTGMSSAPDEIPDDRHAQREKPVPPQTEPEKHLARGDRRAKKPPPPEPDYEKLLDSFKQQPGKVTQQAPIKRPHGTHHDKQSIPVEVLSGTPPDAPFPSQSGGRLPLITAATQVGPVVPQTDNPLTGDAKPPNDF